MKLYVEGRGGQKIYLNQTALNRSELRRAIGGHIFRLPNGATYDVYDVIAESDKSNTAAGAIIGGLIGALAGPAAILLAAGFGGLIGNSADDEEKKRVNTFNASE